LGSILGFAGSPTIILIRKPRNGISIEKKKLRGRNVALHTLRVLALLLSYYALRPYGLEVSNFFPLAFGLGFDPWLCRFTPQGKKNKKAKKRAKIYLSEEVKMSMYLKVQEVIM
jgi:hypothetical protein